MHWRHAEQRQAQTSQLTRKGDDARDGRKTESDSASRAERALLNLPALVCKLATPGPSSPPRLISHFPSSSPLPRSSAALRSRPVRRRRQTAAAVLPLIPPLHPPFFPWRVPAAACGMSRRRRTSSSVPRRRPAGGAFGGNRGVRPVPPERASPLDHLHECDLEKKDYLACLKSTGFQSEKCRQFSKKYLECRMERNLMAKQYTSELGFSSEDVMNTPPDKKEQLDSSASAPKEEK